jgi:ABC-type transporter Mla subunit MlaD
MHTKGRHPMRALIKVILIAAALAFVGWWLVVGGWCRMTTTYR